MSTLDIPNTLTAPPSWMTLWPIAFTARKGPWTLHDRRRWATLSPEDKTVTVVDPAQDSALPGLKPALESGQLIGYRAGRRAVVATGDGFIKILRPSRLSMAVERHERINPHRQLNTPDLVAVHEDGRLVLSRLPGRSLHGYLRDRGSSASQAVIDTAAAIATFHGQTRALPANHKRQVGAEPASNRPDWLDVVARADAPWAHELDRRWSTLDRSAIGLTPATGRRTIVHGDLHDKNVMLGSAKAAGSDGLPSLLDLDDVGFGRPESDVGNLTAHLVLRSLQATGTSDIGRQWSDRFTDAYQQHLPLELGLVRRVEQQTWLRLAGLYRFRRASRHLAPVLADLGTAKR